MFIDRLFKGW